MLESECIRQNLRFCFETPFRRCVERDLEIIEWIIR
jgi:hypothetical protein